jgi:demethylmenaquinone methyltransferase / 2-methoxy-6-polyprenyl-1,4-benzoquinol methylase
MFTSVPVRYDRMNRLMTWGMDVKWRKQAAVLCLESRPARVLDLCCGTGDLSIELATLAGDACTITGFDYSQSMLDIAFRKIARAGASVELVRGDAASMPFEDGRFDTIGVAFAFRNLTWKNPHAQRHLAEIVRVLSPGGSLIIVESSQPSSRLVKVGFQSYLRWFVGRAGASLSGTPGAYRYLAESAASFYTPEQIEKMLLEVGFRSVEYHGLLLGAVGIHRAVK